MEWSNDDLDNEQDTTGIVHNSGDLQSGYVYGGFDIIYGDGSDGSITRSSNGTESGVLHTTNYTIEAGSTREVTGTCIIHAQNSITINGTIESRGSSGGSGGGGSSSSTGGSGSNGSNGLYVDGGGSGGTDGSGNGESGSEYGGAGAGGQGGYGFAENGGSGGDGGNLADISGGPSETQTSSVIGNLPLSGRAGWDELFDLPSNPASSGGGGGGGGTGETSGTRGGDGGDGGDAGGCLVLIAPDIEISGQVDVSGNDGNPGEDGSGSSGSASGAGGGGGGGSGGLLYLIQESLTNTGSMDITGGSGGSGGTDSSNGHSGGDGADGKEGYQYNITVKRLVGWWPLHEWNGRANDLSGYGNHGSVSGATQGVAGRGGLTAYYFSGDIINIPNGVISDTTDFTFSYWMKNTDNGNPDRIFRFDNDLRYIHGIGDNNNDANQRFDVWVDSTWHLSSYNVPSDEWVLIIATYDSSTNDHTIYANTEQVFSFTDPVSGSGDGNAIGADDGGGTPYTGLICDFRIYDYILDPAEMQTLYNWGSADYARPPAPDIGSPTISNYNVTGN